MTSTRDPDRQFTAWISEGPETLRDDVLAAVSTEVHQTPQRRGLSGRWGRLSGMVRAVAVTTGAVAVLAIAVAGIGLLGLGSIGPSVGGPGPVVSPSPPATASPTASPVPSRSPVTTWTLESTVYGYTWPFPADEAAGPPDPATIAWDGRGLCIVQDPCTDWIRLRGEPGTADRYVWALGTPTDLGLGPFAADMQRTIGKWKCPVEPDVTRDIVLDGVPARLNTFSCPIDDTTDLHVRVYAVHDGQGLVISLAKPGTGEALVAADEIDRLLGYLAAFRWAP